MGVGSAVARGCAVFLAIYDVRRRCNVDGVSAAAFCSPGGELAYLGI